MGKGEKFRRAFRETDVAAYEALVGLLKFRRSIRGFREEPVAWELIEKVLEAGRWAPSGGNAQPWEFVVVEDREQIGRLARLFEYQRREKRWLEATQDRRTRMYVADSFPFDGGEEPAGDGLRRAPFREASHLIFCLADDRWQEAFPLRTQLDKGHQHIVSSLASAVLAMHLAAASLGLATQWISDFGSPWLSGMTLHELGIPRSHWIYDVVAVGHPTYYPKPRHVKALDEVVHRGRYDAGKRRSDQEIRDYIATHIRPKLKLAN